MIVPFLVVAALVLFILDSAQRLHTPNIDLTAAGLACLTLAGLIHFWPVLR